MHSVAFSLIYRELQEQNTTITTDSMILLPVLPNKSMAVSALHILGIRSAVVSLSHLNQDTIGIPERIAGSQDSFGEKTNSCSPPDTAIPRLTLCWRCSSTFQIPQRISSSFAFSLYFPSDMPHIRCNLVTLVTKCSLGNHFYHYFGMITEDSETLLRKLHLWVPAADSVVASLQITNLMERVGIPVRSRSGSMNSDWNPVACRMILA